MTQLEFVLNEIKSNGNLTPQQLALLEKIFTEHDKRMLEKFPFYNFFIAGTGQNYGLDIQQKIIDSFNDLTPHKGSSDYDADCQATNEKIEIKSVKAIKQKKDTYIGARVITWKNNKTKCGGSFQQVKPTACDWFILHILFGNKEKLFLVPSSMVSKHPKKENAEPHKIPLSGQHRNHKTEGQINVGQMFKFAKYFEIEEYSHTTSQKYSFQALKKQITKRLDEIGWKLPD